jgi:hypothetical protein
MLRRHWVALGYATGSNLDVRERRGRGGGSIFGSGGLLWLLYPPVDVKEVRAQRRTFCISMVAGFQSCIPILVCSSVQDRDGAGHVYGVTELREGWRASSSGG